MLKITFLPLKNAIKLLGKRTYKIIKTLAKYYQKPKYLSSKEAKSKFISRIIPK